MKWHVKIFNDSDQLISTDIWYGDNIENVKFWIEMSIKDILKNLNYKTMRYEVEEAE